MKRPAYVLVAMLWASLAAAQEPTRADLAKKAKAATALVEVAGGFKHGSAFCLHESGIFLTNDHVVHGAKEVKLILNPGLKNQQIVKAKVVRGDADLDLALLRVDEKAACTPLVLGSSEGLTELTEVIAVGYPFGKLLAFEKGTYPAVSVNAGRITALRLKKGELDRIQMDAVVNPGNSGGPVLDTKGKVIGVVVSGVRGAVVNFAIPVSHVHRFVDRPEVEVLFPAIAFADRYKAVDFRVRAISLIPTKEIHSVELVLAGKSGKERAFKMALKDGLYRTTAEALLAAKGPATLRVTLLYGNGTIQGLVTDRPVKIGGAAVPLSEIRSLRFSPQPQAILTNGKVLKGEFHGLDPLPVQLGGDTLQLKLARALEASVQPAQDESAIDYTIIVRRGDKEVIRLKDVLAFTQVPTASIGDLTKISIPPTIFDKDSLTYKLPSTVGDVAVGGGGRYLILHLNKARTLAVFDVSQAKIIHTLPLSDDNVRFAAGMDKLIVAYPGTKVFQRYSLLTFDREASRPVALKGPVHTLGLGSASSGPLFVGGPVGPGDTQGWHVTFLDLDFNVLPIKMKGTPGIGYNDPAPVRASANGKVFAGWGYGVQAILVEGLEAQLYHVGHGSGAVIPSNDGQFLYTTNSGIFTNHAKEVEGTNRGPRHCSVPAHGYPYHLSVRVLDQSRPGNDPGKGVTVHLGGDARVLATLPFIDDLREHMDGWGRKPMTVDKRLFFIPDAKIIITLPYSDDRLVLYRFDMDDALAKSGIDYLFVTSSPPLSARKGEALTYPIAVKSRRGGVQFKLVAGPPDMALTPNGQLTWPVPMALRQTEVEVIVAISDASRQEIFHTLKLGIRE